MIGYRYNLYQIIGFIVGFLDYELVKVIRVPYIGGDQEVENVGLQTWRASLLLAEYIHFNSELFIGTHILELGAGLVL